MSFGTRLKALRENKGLTQKELAEKLKINRSRLSLYELDDREPDQELTIQIANFFGVTTDYLLGNTDTEPYNTLNKIDNALTEDPELLAFWEETKKRPDLQLFLKQVKSASPKAIRQMMAIIKMIEDEESGEK